MKSLLFLILLFFIGCSSKPIAVQPPAPPPPPCVVMEVSATSHITIVDDGSGPVKTANEIIKEQGGTPCQ
jgi:hypothetical protein